MRALGMSMKDAIPSAWIQVLEDWRNRLVPNQIAQFKACKHFVRRHYLLGISATLLAAATSTSLFATLNKDLGMWPRIATAMVSFISALLTSAVTFLQYGSRAEGYRIASAQFGNVRREIDILQRYMPKSREEQIAALQKVSAEIGEISKQAPPILEEYAKRTKSVPSPTVPSPALTGGSGGSGGTNTTGEEVPVTAKVPVTAAPSSTMTDS